MAFALKGHLMRGCGKAFMGVTAHLLHFFPHRQPEGEVAAIFPFAGFTEHRSLPPPASLVVQRAEQNFSADTRFRVSAPTFFFKSHLGSSNGARLVLMISCRVEETAPGTPRVCGLHFSSYSFSLKKKTAQTTG